MNKIFALAAILFFLITSARAQTTPGIDARERSQRTRIRSGVASGKVTRKEAARLRVEQRQIRRTEKRAKQMA
jgi:hypothetical protein